MTLSGCGGGDSGDYRAVVSVNVLDSLYSPSWDPLEDSTVVYRVEISSPYGADTLSGVVPPSPIVVGDSVVVGLLQVAEDSSAPRRRIFRLQLAGHRVETSALPADVWQSFQDIMVSPDGRYVAYVGEEPSPAPARTYAIVREIATGTIIARGPAGRGCDCDEDTNHARWAAPDSFEIAVSREALGKGWERVAGNSTTRKIHIDTLAAEPRWP